MLQAIKLSFWGFSTSRGEQGDAPNPVTSPISLGIITLQADYSSPLNYLLTFLALFPLPFAYEKPQNTEIPGFFHLIYVQRLIFFFFYSEQDSL